MLSLSPPTGAKASPCKQRGVVGGDRGQHQLEPPPHHKPTPHPLLFLQTMPTQPSSETWGFKEGREWDLPDRTTQTQVSKKGGTTGGRLPP